MNPPRILLTEGIHTDLASSSHVPSAKAIAEGLIKSEREKPSMLFCQFESRPFDCLFGLINS